MKNQGKTNGAVVDSRDKSGSQSQVVNPIKERGSNSEVIEKKNKKYSSYLKDCAYLAGQGRAKTLLTPQPKANESTRGYDKISGDNDDYEPKGDEVGKTQSR